MTAAPLKITGFLGELPIRDSTLLPDLAAKRAINVDLISGALQTLRNPSLAYTPSVSGPWLTAYRAEHRGIEKWRAWNKDVDVAQVPLDQDVEQRYCWTGDGEPKQTGFSEFGTTDWALGVPKPTVAPTVTVSGGAGVNVTRFYRYTWRNARYQESAPSPVSAELVGKIDGTWSISGMQAFPTNSGTFAGTFASGKTTCVDPQLHWLRTGDEVVIDGATYTATVTNPNTFTVPADVSAETAWSRKTPWDTTGMVRQLYRTTGTKGAWQLVAVDLASTTFSDTLLDSAIPGDDLISESWEPPPANLRGLGVLPSGALYGFVERTLCFSVPYQPHAWPLSYQLASAFDIVGCASFGTAVVVATAGTPYSADGNEPESAQLVSVDQLWPCLSKRSVCSVGDGVIYATSHGLAYIGASGSRILTEQEFAPNQWQAMNPSTMICVAAYGKMLVSYRPSLSADERMIKLFMPSKGLGVTELDIPHTELYTDSRNGRIYLLDDDGVKLYDSLTGARMQFHWESKDFDLPAPANYGAGHIDFESEVSEADYAAILAEYEAAVAANELLIANYSGAGDYGGAAYGMYAIGSSNIIGVEAPDIGAVTLTIKVRGVTKFSRTFAVSSRFRLPAGFKADQMSVILSGTAKVISLRMAETMTGLKNV